MTHRVCGARLKNGRTGYCRRVPQRGKARCWFHKGWIGGFRWKDKAAWRAMVGPRHARYMALRRFLGLRQPGGPARKDWRKLEGLVAKAHEGLTASARELRAALPADVEGRADSSLSAPVLLGRAALHGLLRLDEIIMAVPVTEDLVRHETKVARLIGDMALGANKLLMRAAEGEFRARRDDALTRLLESLAEEPLPKRPAKPHK